MITAKDFTKADDEKLPTEAGSYICLLKAPATGKMYYSFGVYSPKNYPEFFMVPSVPGGKIDQYEVIAWAQIEKPGIVAENIMQKAETGG